MFWKIRKVVKCNFKRVVSISKELKESDKDFLIGPCFLSDCDSSQYCEKFLFYKKYNNKWKLECFWKNNGQI